MAKTKKSVFRKVRVSAKRFFDNRYWERMGRKKSVSLNKRDILEIESQAGFYRNRMPD